MFRLRCANSCIRRLFHGTAVNRDQVLEQLQVCSAEDQVFELVGRNKAKLTVEHVGCAVKMLWHFQKYKPQILRTVDFTRSHPEFLTLRVLAENKIGNMDDSVLVDTLYNFLRLHMEPHDSLVQQLVSEAWQRLDRFSMASLSKFAVCIHDQYLQFSPLMGQITNILSRKLSTIDDAMILTVLMVNVAPLVSLRLRDALLSRVGHLLDTMEPSDYNNARRVVQFLCSMKFSHWPLLEKCNQILVCNVPRMDAETINLVLSLSQSLQFNRCDFRLAAKRRLTELIDSSTDCISFTKLFAALAPMASVETREGLENTALLLADELNAQQALAVAEILEEIKCRNLILIRKISSVVQRNIHVYRPVEVARITQAFTLLHYQVPELLTELRHILVKFLQGSFIPYEVTMLTRVLSMLPCPRLDEKATSRLDAVVPQCNLNDLSAIALVVAKGVRNDPSYRHSTPSKYVHLLQALNRSGHDRLQKADRLDFVLDEVKFIAGEWFDEMLVEEVIITLQRLMDQINWTNVSELALFLTKINHLCPPLMDRIASVAIQDIDKIHHSATYNTLLPFAILNYDAPSADEMFDVFIDRLTPQISSSDPHLLVFLAYTFAVVDRFPEELVREIFSIDFLGKLDTQLETVSDSLNMRIRLRLMELNRAVCLECPEFQIPWFHDQYCLQLQKKGNGSINPVLQQIHKMLGEILGGMKFVRAAVVTPYFYTIDFECILDKHHQPVAYSELSTLKIQNRGKVEWTSSSPENDQDEPPPPGAQRVAVDFLDFKSFCKHSHHVRGEPVMQKRHLEILGYRVVQIPHFELNSMELSTQDAWKEYLKKKIFGELSS
ncbi:FAST kinase domain-containing protein 1, mitochondrial [Genypterus blacodes]|uniref:FAST kinase domain-containing protein 1, mitochondrial n=1 Tax=Genypterus blacodes TaxID=154954 RepID=UPI003F76C0BD